MTTFHKWLNRSVEENYYTPDMPDLQRTETNYVFLADNLMRGKARHHYLVNDDWEYLGKAFTKSATYGIMMMHSTIEPVNPVYFEVVPNNEAAFIYGELYEVPPTLMVELDYHQANRLITKRKKVQVVTRGSELEVTAWTWLADVDYFTDPKAADKLKPYTLREYLWNIPVIAWDSSIFTN